MRHLHSQLQGTGSSISQQRLRSAGLAYFSASHLKCYEPRPSADGPRAKGGLFLTLTDWQHKGFAYHKGDLWLLGSSPSLQVICPGKQLQGLLKGAAAKLPHKPECIKSTSTLEAGLARP